MSSPIFLSFEGCEGSGKTTQAELLFKRLWATDIQAILVHEPGTTPLGRHLRNYLKSLQPLSREAELLLFEAARAELVNTQIKPNLHKGLTVISDRYAASSIAYQGYGRKIDLDIIRRLNSFATQGINPNRTILLDLDPAEGLRRVGSPQLVMPLALQEETEPVREDIEGHRRFEDQPLQFHKKIRDGYLSLAKEDPEHWVILDATLSEEEISRKVWSHVLETLELAPPVWEKERPL